MFKKTFLFKDKKTYKKFIDKAKYKFIDKAKYKFVDTSDDSLKDASYLDNKIGEAYYKYDKQLQKDASYGVERQKAAQSIRESLIAISYVINSNVDVRDRLNKVGRQKVVAAARKVLANISAYERIGGNAPEIKRLISWTIKEFS